MRNIRTHRLAGGFSLIELLVVVAIIAALISVLLPSLNKARANARMVQCLANLKNMGMAAEMYANAQGNYYPPLWARGGVVVNGVDTWDYRWTANREFRKNLSMDLSAGLQEHEGIFCPDGPVEQKLVSNWGGHYGSNNYGTVPQRSDQGGTKHMISMLRSKMPTPALKAQFVDATDFSSPAVEDAINPAVRWDTFGDVTGKWTAAYRHLEKSGINVAHYDGHASHYTRGEAYPTVDGVAVAEAVKRIWLLQP
jgi:prepilin-type N-terminal cleavage/methylation domain-containing protein